MENNEPAKTEAHPVSDAKVSKTIYIHGMTCASCERLVTKAVESAGGKVHSVDAKEGKATIELAESGAAFEKVKDAIVASGYVVAESKNELSQTEPFGQQMEVFLKKLLSGEKGLSAERKILKMSLLSFLLIIFAGFFLYLFAFRGMPSFSSLFPFLFYTIISAVALTASMAHYRSHKGEFTCMEGMMIGMTIGMMAGFLFGAVIGATNGMFVGSVFGMAIGMLAGAWAGKCCGIMGVMEGMMAGLMGGTMGAMLTVMMLADNLMVFMPIFVASCLAILAGLTYMIYNSAGKRGERELMKFDQFLSLCLLFTLATAIIMLFGPRGPVTIPL
jgi:copper chaperone CopZ